MKVRYRRIQGKESSIFQDSNLSKNMVHFENYGQKIPIRGERERDVLGKKSGQGRATEARDFILKIKREVIRRWRQTIGVTWNLFK